MKEIERIIQLYKSAYDGNPWIDVSLMPVLKPITAKQAATKVSPHWNTIWEIVNHIISWRENVLKRIQGQVIKTPAHNYFVPVKDVSSAAWQKALKKLEVSQHQWIVLLKNFNEKDFEKIYPNNDLTYYEHIHGIIQHDIYHLGQVVMLAKVV